ncbi:hydrogenase, partial [bacterium AH-315-I07]|nr:hydrogenase [bacterium AH-315-I07]
CSAKKEEISWGDEIDIVLTFEEMVAIFKASGIDPAKETPVEMNDATNIGRMFAHSGGVVGAVAKLLDLEKYPVKIVYPTTLKGSLRTLKLEAGKAAKGDGFTIVEGMACPAGCISGSGTIVAVNTSNRALTKYINDGCNEK